jgi:hypothetical protein
MWWAIGNGGEFEGERPAGPGETKGIADVKFSGSLGESLGISEHSLQQFLLTGLVAGRRHSE